MAKKDQINEEEKIEKISEKKEQRDKTIFFIHIFLKQLKEDKKYLISLLITLTFLAVASINKVQNSESFIKKETPKEEEKNVTPTVSPNVDNNQNKKETLDIKNNVGIYSREIVLNEKIKLSSTCEITSYKYIYNIKSDKTITKYLANECLGTIKVWSDKLKYAESSSNIVANEITYIFGSNSVKEADGEIYKIDEDIKTINESNLIKDNTYDFYNDNIVITTNEDLFLIKGNTITSSFNKDYKNHGGAKIKRFYKTDIENTYSFVVFENNEEKICYENSTSEDVIYNLYKVEYDKESNSFKKPEIVVTKTKKDECKDIKDELLHLK